MLALSALLSVQTAHSQDMAAMPLSGAAPDIVLTDAHKAEIKLSKFFEQKRILFMYIPTDANLKAKGYMSSLVKNERKLLERDVQVIAQVNDDSVLLQEPYPSWILIAPSEQRIQSATPADPDAPLCVLIGKDRTIKLREPNFIDVNALINKIDAMPMRKAEAKK